MTTLTITAPVAKLCPYKDEVDEGTATLVFDVPTGDGPELHDLAEHLDTFREIALSHEDFTRLVAKTFECAARTTWQTAGMTVEVVHP